MTGAPVRSRGPSLATWTLMERSKPGRRAWTLPELTYEFRKDAASCALLGATFWLALRRRDRVAATPAGTSGSTLQAIPEHLWLRDGATTIRVKPRDVVWLSSAGNYVEYRMADGTTGSAVHRRAAAGRRARNRPGRD